MYNFLSFALDKGFGVGTVVELVWGEEAVSWFEETFFSLCGKFFLPSNIKREDSVLLSYWETDPETLESCQI